MCDSDPAMYGSLQKNCSYATWRHPRQNGKSHTYSPLNPPRIFPCNSEAWGDNWLKNVIKSVLAFSLGSPAFEALCTQPGVPVSRCCILLIKCVNQYRLAEAMSYIKRQMFNNEPRKVVRRAQTQLHDGKKNGSRLPHQCLLTLPMFSWKIIYVAPFLALAHWLNTLLIWIAAFVCWGLTALWGLQRRDGLERTQQKYLCESRELKSQVRVISSDMQVFKAFFTGLLISLSLLPQPLVILCRVH